VRRGAPISLDLDDEASLPAMPRIAATVPGSRR